MPSMIRRYLLNREVQNTDSAIRIIALPRTGRLSGLGLRIEMTNGATRGAALIQDQINRVEVIANGSEVLFSLEGNELYRWNWRWLRQRPPMRRDETNGVVQELFLIVPFGMELGDENYCLDLSLYQTVELRINYTTTVSATSFVTNTTTFSAILYLWPEGSYSAPRLGYFRTTQFRAFTSLASGEDVTELPRRNKLLDVMVFNRHAATAPETDLSLIEIRENDGVFIPYTGRWADIVAENDEMVVDMPVESGIAFAQDTDTLDVLVQRPQGIVLAPVFVQSDANGIVTVDIGSLAGDRVTLSASELADAAATTHFTAYASRRAIHWQSRGYGIPGAVYIPLFDLEDPQSAYDAPSKAKVALAITQAASGATVRASMRELVAA